VYAGGGTGGLCVWDGIQWVALNDSKKAITGSSDPTSSTEGELGQLYLNTTSGELFYCSATGGTYTWTSLDSPIQSISVNGTAVTPDANKNVNLTIPDGIKTLTTADYNYPMDNPTSVAWWLLDTGIYKIPCGLRMTKFSGQPSFQQTDADVAMLWVFNAENNETQYSKKYIYSSGRYGVFCYEASTDGTQESWPQSTDDWALLTQKNVTSSLNTGSTTKGYVLDARQGKVLADRIGNLSTLTTTAKTSAVAAINELDSELDNAKPLSGSTAPTTSTVGTLGQTYVDTSTGDIYYLSEIDETTSPTTYTWEKLSDAATKGYVDNAIINGGTTQPTTSTVGAVGTQYNCVNNGEPEIYICTAVDTSTTPNTYTWKKVGLTLQLSTTDPGEGSPLADNTLLGIYE